MLRAKDRETLQDKKAARGGRTRPVVHLAAVHLAVDGCPVSAAKVALLLQELRKVAGKVRSVHVIDLALAQRPHDAHPVHVDEALV